MSERQTLAEIELAVRDALAAVAPGLRQCIEAAEKKAEAKANKKERREGVNPRAVQPLHPEEGR